VQVLHTSAEKDELEQVLSGMGEWSFDVWDLVKVSERRERASRKRNILAVDLAKWLQT